MLLGGAQSFCVLHVNVLISLVRLFVVSVNTLPSAGSRSTSSGGVSPVRYSILEVKAATGKSHLLVITMT